MAYLVNRVMTNKPQKLTPATDKIPNQYYQFLTDNINGSVYRSTDRKRAFFVAKKPFVVYDPQTLKEVKRLSSGRYMFLRDRNINGRNFCLIGI